MTIIDSKTIRKLNWRNFHQFKRKRVNVFLCLEKYKTEYNGISICFSKTKCYLNYIYISYFKILADKTSSENIPVKVDQCFNIYIYVYMF